MSQKIPFFELFSALPLDRETRVALDGAYLTAVEVERERRTMHMALTVRADMGERMSHLSAAVAQAYGLEGFRVTNRAEMEEAFQKALDSGKGCVLDCVLDMDEMVRPMVAGGAHITDFLLK